MFLILPFSFIQIFPLLLGVLSPIRTTLWRHFVFKTDGSSEEGLITLYIPQKYQ